jgi:putative hemolysin
MRDAMHEILYLLMVFCVLASAFFSGAEIAVVSIGRIQLRRMMKEGKPGSSFLEKVKKHQRKTIVTVLIGNTVVNITASTIAAALAIEAFGDIGVGIATGAMTFILLLVGEVIPKSFASSHSETAALFAAPLLYYAMRVLSPVVWFFDFFARLVSKSEKRPFSEKDIHAIVELGVEEKVLEPNEQKLILRVLQFNDVPVREVMVPFKKFISLNADSTVAEASKIVLKHGFSRFPIYSEQKENIVGIVRAKDLVEEFSAGRENRLIHEIILPTLRVKDSELIDDVFVLFQKSHNHMGFVVDQSDSVLGLVTMEDLLEEIVGEYESDRAKGKESPEERPAT